MSPFPRVERAAMLRVRAEHVRAEHVRDKR